MLNGCTLSEVVLAKQKILPWLTIHQLKSELKKTAQFEVMSTAFNFLSTATFGTKYGSNTTG